MRGRARCRAGAAGACRATDGTTAGRSSWRSRYQRPAPRARVAVRWRAARSCRSRAEVCAASGAQATAATASARGGQAAAGDGGDQQCGEHGRYGVDGVDERSGQPGAAVRGAVRRGGVPALMARASSRASRAPWATRASRSRPSTSVPNGCVREGGAGARWCPGRGGSRRPAARTASRAPPRERRCGPPGHGGGPVQGGRRARRAGPGRMSRRTASQAAPAASAASSTRGQRARLEDGQVLGEGGSLEGGAAEAGDVEDLLHGDGAAGHADDEQRGVRQQSGQTAPYRLPGDAGPGQPRTAAARTQGSVKAPGSWSSRSRPRTAPAGGRGRARAAGCTGVRTSRGRAASPAARRRRWRGRRR